MADVDSKARKQAMTDSTTIYVAPGYLLFARDRTLMAQPFDTGKHETTGDAVPVAQEVDVNTAGVGVAVGYFSASENGVSYTLRADCPRSPNSLGLTMEGKSSTPSARRESWDHSPSLRMRRG